MTTRTAEIGVIRSISIVRLEISSVIEPLVIAGARIATMPIW